MPSILAVAHVLIGEPTSTPHRVRGRLSSEHALAGPFMSHTFVLVHGAWHGGWCWRRVADRLRGGGHTVYAPTLTGLGERAHLMRAGIGLDTHIADVEFNNTTNTRLLSTTIVPELNVTDIVDLVGVLPASAAADIHFFA